MNNYAFTVYGKPAGKGSKRIGRANGGRPIILDDNKRTKPWQQMVCAAAIDAIGVSKSPFTGPVEVTIIIEMARPKSHYGSGKKSDVLKANAPFWCLTKPDVDKVARTVLDALTGVAYKDDSQVGISVPIKVYGDRDMVTIEVIQLTCER